jgi:hypothetical protein
MRYTDDLKQTPQLQKTTCLLYTYCLWNYPTATKDISKHPLPPEPQPNHVTNHVNVL